jgi:hypothetical protein
MARCTCAKGPRQLTHQLPADGLLRAALLMRHLERTTDLSKGKIAEVAEKAARRGWITAGGKLRAGKRLPLT